MNCKSRVGIYRLAFSLLYHKKKNKYLFKIPWTHSPYRNGFFQMFRCKFLRACTCATTKQNERDGEK